MSDETPLDCRQGSSETLYLSTDYQFPLPHWDKLLIGQISKTTYAKFYQVY